MGLPRVARVPAQSILVNTAVFVVLALLGSGLSTQLCCCLPAQVIRRIISQTERFNAPDVFQGLQELSVLKAKVGGVC